jgi:hypothetical protein
MSDGGMWETEPEKPWYEPEDPELGLSPIRIVAVVVLVTISLILLGMPTNDPIGFVLVVAAFSICGVVRGLWNRELARALKRKG